MTSDVAASAQFQSEIDCHDSAENHMKAAFPLCFSFVLFLFCRCAISTQKAIPEVVPLRSWDIRWLSDWATQLAYNNLRQGLSGLEDTFFATDRSVPQCLRLVRPDFGERNLQTHDVDDCLPAADCRFEGLNFAEEEPT